MSSAAQPGKWRERRSAERLEIHAAVTCTVGVRSLDGVAYDLSTDGCMIEVASAAPRAGDPIVLCFRGQLSIEGKVVWAKHRNAGIRFSGQLDRLIVNRMVKVHGRRRCGQARAVETARYSVSPGLGDAAAMAGTVAPGSRCLSRQRCGLASGAEYAFWILTIAYSTVLIL